MNGKTIAIVSYITIIGWLIAFFVHSSAENKESIASFHIRQSLGVFLTGIAGMIVLNILTQILSVFGILILIYWLAVVVFLIMGLISAVQEEEKPLPVVGEHYQKWFAGIK